MIIICSRPGQLGNQLIVYASFLAFSMERGVKIVNPSFARYIGYFKQTGPLKSRLQEILYHFGYYMARVLCRLRHDSALLSATCIDWNESINLDSTGTSLAKSNFHFVQGWQYRANQSLQKHADTIRAMFRPLPQYQQKIDLFYQEYLREREMVIGIHVRLGDYRTFESGKYFYSEEEYGIFMQGLNSLFGGRQITFLVCSNEKLLRKNFPSNLKILFAPGHELTDLYLLARCQYIAGPPSTYSMWASFYGKVPLYMIRDCKITPQKTDFTIQHQF